MLVLVDGKIDDLRLNLFASLFVQFEGIVLGMVFLLVVVFLRIAVECAVYTLAVSPERGSKRCTDSFDFAHVITECGFRLPAA